MPADRSSENGVFSTVQETNLLPQLYHDLNLTMTLDELVDRLSTSEKCTSLFMASEAVATWRQYHIHTIEELTPDVLSRLYEKLKYIAKMRGWSLLPVQWEDLAFQYEYYNGRRNVIVTTFDPSPLTCAENETPLTMIYCFINGRYDPFCELTKETRLLFHFKHPATPQCKLLSNCGFILKTVPSESALWRVKLCTEEEDYKDEMMHFHDEVNVDKIHLCFIYGNLICLKRLVPLSWLGWLTSDDQREEWRKNYSLCGSSRFAVLYDTTV